MIIIDEIQDCSILYFKIIYKFIIDTKFNGNFVFFGDIDQSVYKIFGAVPYFLSCPYVFSSKVFEILE